MRNRCVCASSHLGKQSLVQAVTCASSHLGKGQLWVAVGSWGSQLAVQRSCVVTYYGHGLFYTVTTCR